jgi:N-acetylglucosaminyl-diphospho-decaprenol L-rhamnosyltransferase
VGYTATVGLAVTRVGVGIITHDSSAVLDACLTELASSNYDPHALAMNVVVVDSGSTDVGYLNDAERSYIHVIKVSDNIGYGSACNLASQYLVANDWLIFMNPDVLISYETLRGLVSSAVKQGFDCVGPILKDPKGAFLQDWGRCITPPWRNRAIGWRFDGDFIECETFTGAVLAISSSMFERLGGFDESFFLYCEEMDLHRRIGASGGRVGVSLSHVATHTGSGSSSDVSSRWRSVQRATGHTRYVRKHFGMGPAVSAAGWNILRIFTNPIFEPKIQSLREFLSTDGGIGALRK